MSLSTLLNITFGLRGAIVPPGAFKGNREAFVFEGFPIEIDDGVIAIGFEDPSLAEQTRAIVRQHLGWFSAEHGVRYVADLNQSWDRMPDGTTAFRLSVRDTIKVSDDVLVTRAIIQGTTRIVATYKNTSLVSYSALTAKSLRSDALRDALMYFNDEAIDEERPLYGIYKALEALMEALPGGREELGLLAGRVGAKAAKKYVDDVMQTAQLMRHHNDPNARQILTDRQSKERAKALIDVFAKSIP